MANLFMSVRSPHTVTVNRTRILLALLCMVVMLQLFPGQAALIKLVAVSAGGLWCVAWAGSTYMTRRKQRLAEAAQAAADASEYQQYKAELDAIRARHDPHRDLTEPTSISPEYAGELAALHDKHQAMLDRKFGPR